MRPTLLDPSKALRTTSAPHLLADDLDLDSLASALNDQVHYFRTIKPHAELRFADLSISTSNYARALEELANIIRQTRDQKRVVEYIRENFEFWEVYGDEGWGDVRITSYFEPVIQGSLTPNKIFSRPLYAKPTDLLNLSLSSFSPRFAEEPTLKARIDSKSHVVPYWTREQIDQDKVLTGKNLELCWVDPVDAFFLHIQGSGTVVLEDGSELYINYADKNGQRYEAVGKFLKQMISGRITMQAIVEKLRSMRASEQDSYLFKNPSYVFFRRSNQRAVTALGIPATPGRTIATDSKLFPKGALAFLTFEKPVFADASQTEPTFEKASRFVLNQDAGGAITGPGRVDLFWGRGPEAGRVAGSLHSRGTLHYLVPRASVAD